MGNGLDDKSEEKGNSYFSSVALKERWHHLPIQEMGVREGLVRRAERERKTFEFIHKLEVPVGHLSRHLDNI